MTTPLTAEAAFYVLEEEQGVYNDFWESMGYYLEHGGDVPPYKPEAKRPNNRASDWHGTFAFTFAFCNNTQRTAN